MKPDHARLTAPFAVLLVASGGCASNPDCGHDWYGGGTATVSIEWQTGEALTSTADGVSQAILDGQEDSVDSFDLGEFSLRALWEETGEGAAVIGWPRGPEEAIHFAMAVDVADFPSGAFETAGGSPSCATLEPVEPPAYLFVGLDAAEQEDPVRADALAHIRNGFDVDQAVVWEHTICDSDAEVCNIELDLVDKTTGSMVFVQQIAPPVMPSCQRQVTTTVRWDFDEGVTRSVYNDCGGYF